MKKIVPKIWLPIINGLRGNHLEESHSPFAIRMNLRVNGRDVPVEKLGANMEGRDVIVLIHGLMADERIWEFYGERLKNYYPVLYIRYNTGRHISHNGKDLSALLKELKVKMKVGRFHLMGHSMGGLVIRSACYYASVQGADWIKHIASIFLVAVPNRGAGLEKLGYVTEHTLKKIQRWCLANVGNALGTRSDGIKDLRMGVIVEEDWKTDRKAIRDLLKLTPVPPLDSVRYHILVGNLTKDEKSKLGRYFGDGLVSQSSATGHGILETAVIKIFPGTGHNSILRNETVYAYLLEQLKA